MDLAHFMQQFGVLFVVLGTLVEGELTLIVAGFAAFSGHISLPMVVVSAFVGSVTGDTLSFYGGRKWGGRILKRWPKLEKRRLDMGRVIERYPAGVILVLRFQIAMRMVGCFTIGASPITSRRFFLWNTLACCLWSALITLFCFHTSRIWIWFFDYWRSLL
ncbi:MAG: DedA family protein [Planctomycetes bacterium]|nr:DedA family protein [Planctomycetota bacterium]